MSTWSKVMIAAAVEIAYAVFTRTWLRHQLDGAGLELAVSVARGITVVVYLMLFRDLIGSRPKAFRTLYHPLLAASVLIAMAVPVAFQGWAPGGGIGTTVVFILTSFIVGFREELLYRAVILNLLQPRLGTIGALSCSTVLFAVYHYGAQPITWISTTEIVTRSVLLGLVYIRSGSLATVTAIHSIYDAIWFMGPVVKPALADAWRPVFLVSAMLFGVVWSFLAVQAPIRNVFSSRA
jgi:membrane protease YdiL (CAAX protease family)